MFVGNNETCWIDELKISDKKINCYIFLPRQCKKR